MPTRAFSIEDGNLGSKTILTSRTKSSQDIDLSFAKKPSGDVFKKTDAAAVKQAVKNLLLTNFSEKPFLPRFGGNLNSLLFALNTDIDDEDLEEQIINAIEIYEPRARVTNISSNLSDDDHQIKVTVTFRIINTNETVTTNIDLTRLR
jgi:phage baseplate assembly protein W